LSKGAAHFDAFLIFMYPTRPRRHIAVLGAILLLALALRVAAVFTIGVSDIVTYTESGVTAGNFVKGNGYTFDYYGLRPNAPVQAFMPPVYPALIALCLRYTSDPPRALELTQAILSMLTILLIYLSATILSNQVIALLTSAGLAIYPVFVVMPAYPISLTLNALLLTLSVYLCLRLAEKRTVPIAVATGVGLGVAILAKPQQLAFVPVIAVWLWLNVRENRPLLLKRLALVIVMALLILLPWSLRNYAIFGQFVFVSTSAGFSSWVGNNPFTTGSAHDVDSARLDTYLGVPHDLQKPAIIGNMIPYPMPKELANQGAALDELALDRALLAASLNFIRSDPGRWLDLVAQKFIAFWWVRSNVGLQYEPAWTRYYQVIYAVLAAFAIPGLLLSLRQWRRYSLLYLVVAYYCVVEIAATVQTRYRWEMEPYFLLFAALTVLAVARRLRISGLRLTRAL
jgi:4-amino-4-deoxy-L-arabinose transferase-like glycosyltransferase